MKGTIPRITSLLMAILLGVACAASSPHGTLANQKFSVPETVAITAGPFIAGSDAAEREAAYVLDEAAYGHNRTRKFGWYDRERKRASHDLPAFEITRTPITNSQYAAFVAETGHPAPDVDEATWKGYRLIHPFARTRRHAWRDGAPPDGRAAHPVVMVSHADATAYGAWLSAPRPDKPGAFRASWNGKKPLAACTERTFHGATSSTLPASTAMIQGRLIRLPSVNFPPAPVPSACSMPPDRFSNGRIRRAIPGAFWSRAAHGTTRDAASADRRRAMPARRQ